MPQVQPSPPPANAAAGTPSLRTLGTGATEAAAGNDGRLGSPTNAQFAPGAGKIPLADGAGKINSGWLANVGPGAGSYGGSGGNGTVLESVTLDAQGRVSTITTATAALRGDFFTNYPDLNGPGSVRYQTTFDAATGSATEHAALYLLVQHGTTWDTEKRYNVGLYIDTDQYQQLAGNGASKVRHRGWGDAHFVALLQTGDQVPITNASNTSPIVVTTSRPHGFGHDNVYLVEGVTGNTAANSNAFYGCRVISPTQIELWHDGNPVAGNNPYTGGGAITCINSPVGYEAAHFSERFVGVTNNSIGRANGAVGFLSSVQGGFSPIPGVTPWPSGLSRNKLFEALVENDQLFSGACFIASDTPNRAFMASKRQYFQDGQPPLGVLGTTAGVQTMFGLEEAYYNPQANDGTATPAMARWTLQADATMKFFSLLSTSGTTTQDSPDIFQFGSYWDGAASKSYGLRHRVDVTGTAPAANYDLVFTDGLVDSLKFRFMSDGTFMMMGAGTINTQGGNIVMGGGDITGLDDLTFGGATSVLDLSGGDIVGVDDMTFAGVGSILDLGGGDVMGIDDMTFAGVGSILDLGGGDIVGVDDFTFGGAGSVLSLNGGDVIGIDSMTFAGSGSILDLQLGDLLAVGDFVYRSSSQGTGVDSDAMTTTQRSPFFILDGTYWDGAASQVYGMRCYMDVNAVTPAGQLLMQFGTAGSRTTRFAFKDDSTLDFQGGQITAITGGIAGCGDITLNNAKNIVLGTGAGSQIATSNAQKLAFWGAAPVVQPSTAGTTGITVPGAGNALLDDTKSDGGLGGIDYTFGDIVRCLKLAGLITV